MSHKPKVAKLDGLAKLPHLTVCRRAQSVVISGHVTRHVVDFSNYTDFSKFDETRCYAPGHFI